MRSVEWGIQSETRHLVTYAGGAAGVLECGEFSPLLQGDLSLSLFAGVRVATGQPHSRQREHSLATEHIPALDGDKSPA